jgi:hypothetical protein
MKFIKHLKYKNKSLKNNKKHLKEFNKTLGSETYKFKFISSIFVSFYNKMMQSVKKLKKDSIKNNKSTKRKKNKSKNLSNKFQ